MFFRFEQFQDGRCCSGFIGGIVVSGLVQPSVGRSMKCPKTSWNLADTVRSYVFTSESVYYSYVFAVHYILCYTVLFTAYYLYAYRLQHFEVQPAGVRRKPLKCGIL